MARIRRHPQFFDRVLGAALLNTSVYGDVAQDRAAAGQALLIVAVATIAAGIGGLHAGVTGLIVGLVASLIGWVVYAVLVYWIGTSVYGARRTPGSLAGVVRALGFASSPRVLLFLGFIPVLGIIVGVVVLIWTLVTTVVAVQETLRLDTGSAVVTAVLGWIALFVGSFLIAAVL
jgi:hypothetical protein